MVSVAEAVVLGAVVTVVAVIVVSVAVAEAVEMVGRFLVVVMCSPRPHFAVVVFCEWLLSPGIRFHIVVSRERGGGVLVNGLYCLVVFCIAFTPNIPRNWILYTVSTFLVHCALCRH